MSEESLLLPQIRRGDSPTVPAFVQFLQCAILPVWARSIVFLLFAAVLPLISYAFLGLQHRYHLIVQVALSTSSAVAFYTLAREQFDPHFKMLSQPVYCDKIVKVGMFLLYLFLLSFGIVDLCYRYPNEAFSWVSRLLAIVDLLCLVYRVALVLTCSFMFSWTCYLHTLHLKGVSDQFEASPDMSEIEASPDMSEILYSQIEMKEQLITTSADYQSFIVIGLVGTAVLYQISTTFWLTQPQQDIDWFGNMELMLCSACLVCSMFLCLYSASCANSLAHGLASSVATWHAQTTIGPPTASCDSFVGPNMTTSVEGSQPKPSSSLVTPNTASKSPIPPPTTSGSVSTPADPVDSSAALYHRREALVKFMENNYMGVMAFGLRIDGAWLYGLFTFEVSLILWLLGKTLHF
ncbi:hypothetical protein LUZ62_060801 [Rhynchospora pubera]|uniref:Gustatory receptor n=1 Tax=Rhynchospora pubera TaxID=906938 RepID=A0AAV8EB60_9POAL|nr:hypothetical protein LUZ62_060801 [Rhynchospora pubera]